MIERDENGNLWARDNYGDKRSALVNTVIEVAESTNESVIARLRQ